MIGAGPGGLTKRVDALKGMLVAFEEPNFRLLWIGRFSSNIGRMLRVVVRGWMVYELTDSALLMGVVWSSLSWPMLFMPLLGGVLADRFDRRKLLLATETSLVLLWAAVSLLITLGLIQWWHFMVSSIISGVVQSIGRPGHQAMVGSVVDRERLPNAVALDSVAQTWPMAVGPALAGILKGVGLGWDVLFWMTTFLQGFTTVTIYLLRWQPRFQPQSQPRGVIGGLLEGLAHIRGQTVLVGLLALGICASLFAGSYNFLLPIFVGEILHLPDYWLGWLMTASALGSSAGSMAVVALSQLGHRGRLLMMVVSLYCVLVIVFSQSQLVALSLAFLFGMGLSQVMTRTVIRMAMQLLAPDELRGRIMSLQVFLMGVPSFGVLLLGALAQYLGAPYALALAGVMYGAAAVALFSLMPQLRRFD